MSPMRILVVAGPGVGHLLPLLPLATAAARRGHDVRVGCGASLDAIVHAAGLPRIDAGPARIQDAGAAIPGMADASPRRRPVLMFRHAFCGSIASAMTGDLLAATETWRPDVVVREDTAFAGYLLGAALDIPTATVQVTAWRPRMLEVAAPPLADRRAELGLPPDPDLATIHGDVLFAQRPASLRAVVDPWPTMTAELRPIADDTAGTDPGDDLELADDRPRVLVTLGTIQAERRDLLHTLIDGVVAAGAQPIVALGSDPGGFGAVPPGTIVRAWIPLSAALPAVDAVVSHGGSGTFTASLAAGRPLILVPLGADQHDNAAEAHAAGVGRTLEVAEVTETAIRDAVAATLADDAMRERAQAVAREIAAMPGPDAAVERLERIVASR